MIPTHLAKDLTVKQLKALVSEFTKEANIVLTEVRARGGENISPSFVEKWTPYLKEHGTKRGAKFKAGAAKATKKELINKLQNLQKFKKQYKNLDKLEEEAEQTAKKLGLQNTEQLSKLFELVKHGYDSLAYKIGSDDMFKITTERLNAGQTPEEIEAAINSAAEKAENGDEFVNLFSEGGTWL